MNRFENCKSTREADRLYCKIACSEAADQNRNVDKAVLDKLNAEYSEWEKKYIESLPNPNDWMG